MNNTQLHILGSKTFYSLFKEIDEKQPIYFFDKLNKNYFNDFFERDIVRIIFPEKFSLVDIRHLIELNVPNIFLLEFSSSENIGAGDFLNHMSASIYVSLLTS